MDVPRKKRRVQRAILRSLLAAACLALVVAVTIALSHLEPAAPKIDRQTILVGTVSRGEMLREIRGVGTLIPEEETWVTAVTAGRVKRLPVQAGVQVGEDTVLLELTNPDLELAALNATSQLKSAEAELAAQRAESENAILITEAALAVLEAEYKVAKLRVAANESLYKSEVLPELEMEFSRVQLEAVAKRLEAERQRQEMSRESEKAKLAVREAHVEQAKALHELKLSQLDSLRVRAGVEGVLEQFPQEIGVGKQVGAGAVLAKISNPNRLKAVLKVAESQARDAQVGLPVIIEVLNRELAGRVTRIDPAVIEGSVTVDVQLLDPLPRGARPDLSVVGTIEIERLVDVIYVDRPVFAAANRTTLLFKLAENGTEAVKVPVEFGRSSVTKIEVVDGLDPGDEVILSDMNRWDHVDRLRIRGK